MKKKTIGGLILSATLFLFMPVLALGQNAPRPEIVEVQVVSEISIENAKIVSQNGNEIKVTLDLFNGGKNIQPDIFYSIKLMEQKETYQTIAETKNYSDSVDLSAGERAHKEVVYNASDFLTGNFQVWVEAHNSKGTSLMQAFIGEVELKGSAGYISIEKDTCNVKVQGEEIEYGPSQGVDISSDETLVGTCLLKNNFPVAKQAGIRFEVRYRSVSGNIVSNSKGEDVSFEAGGQKEVSFILPKEKKPQAYEIKMFLVGSDEKKNSNETLFHYVLTGKSVTIQNVSLNSDGYENGSQAKISFFLSSSADSFIDSRKGGTNIEEVFASVEMKNKDGKSCLGRNEYKIESNFSGVINLDIPVINSCQNPSMVVSVKDKDGNILDSANFLMGEKVKSPAESEKFSTPGMFTGKNILEILGLLTLLLVVIIIIVKKIKKRGAMMMFLLFSFSALMAFGLPGNSKANGGSFVVGTRGFGIPAVYTVNLDKSTYVPGEQMVVSGSGFGGMCNNGWAWIALAVAIPFPEGNTVTVFVLPDGVLGPAVASGSIYRNAPTTPGDYIARFWGSTHSEAHTRGTFSGTFDVPFTVVAPLTLNVVKTGTGTGTITSNPAGIDCGITCDYNFVEDSGVTLAATPASGSTFSGWSGTDISCPGTGDCSVTMDANKTVTAKFDTCVPDCTCAANVCTGGQCLDGCGGYCNGTMLCCFPDCACAANTCKGKTCSDECSGNCNGTKDCSANWREVAP